MAESKHVREPWLVAAWPGMGGVALIAGSYLVQHLKARKVHELDAREFFDVQAVDVRNGIARPGQLPHGIFFQWTDPRARQDLLIFLGEAQPPTRGYALCRRVVEYAAARGVTRLFTFAAIATQLHPGTPPRTFAAATDIHTLGQATAAGVDVLESGSVGGMNGLLLAAGAERGIPGTCLLGELPYFAVEVPNPGAAKAVLDRFIGMAGIQVDLAPLDRQARAHEQYLLRLLEQLASAGEAAAPEFAPEEAGEPSSDQPEDEFSIQEGRPPASPRLDDATSQRIEALFEQAARDRAKAVELKRELDQLGVFKQFEDRFLDLFRQAG